MPDDAPPTPHVVTKTEPPRHGALLTLKQVADRYSVDYDTVLKWCNTGALPFVHVGPTRLKRVYQSDAERMVRLVPLKTTFVTATFDITTGKVIPDSLD